MTYPYFFYEAVMQERQRNLDRKLRHEHSRRQAQLAAAAPTESVLLRLGRAQDAEALVRLATLQERRASTGRHVVAEVGGAIVAALPLRGGAVLADPFRRTAHLIPLLELRARQLTGNPTRRRPLGGRLGIRRWSRA
ncbi:MAG: hypothetical protein ACXVZP_10645 [Gaiellaceae bacterium]